MSDAETVNFYESIRKRVEVLGLQMTVESSFFTIDTPYKEHSFSTLEQLDCFVRGLEARG